MTRICTSISLGLGSSNIKSSFSDDGKYYVVQRDNNTVYFYQRNDCNTSCLQCRTNDTNFCLSCVNGATPLGGICAGSNCSSTCSFCRSGNASACLACKANSYILSETSAETICGTCASTSYSKSGDYCLLCTNSSCTSCSQTNIGYCRDCPFNTYRYLDGGCGGCLLTDHQIYNNRCIECREPSCQTCDPPNPYACSTCPYNTYLYSTKKCGDCTETGYSHNFTDCVQCSPRCSTCNPLIPSECLTCITPTTYSIMPNKSCDICPPVGYMRSGINCLACAANCSTCGPTNPSQCILCLPGYYKYGNNTCGICMENGVTVVSTMCSPCGTNCNTCQLGSPNICLTCTAGNYLYPNSTCQACTETGVVQNGLNCLACGTACLNCESTNASICITCNPDRYLYPAKTCDYCNETGAVISNVTHCIICGTNCDTCNVSNLTQCLVCTANNYIYPDSHCGSCTETGYVLSGGLCLPCPTNCSSCDAVNTSKCITCTSTYYLYTSNSTCGLCGETGVVIYGSTCLTCGTNCKTCESTNTSKCLTCRPGTFLYPNFTCSSCSEDGFVQDGRLCRACGPTCKTCLASSLAICTSCLTGNYIYSNGTCGTCTEDGFSISGSNCVICDPSCKTCDSLNTSTCLSCYPNKYFVNGTSACAICDTIRSHIANNNCITCKPDQEYSASTSTCLDRRSVRYSVILNPVKPELVQLAVVVNVTTPNPVNTSTAEALLAQFSPSIRFIQNSSIEAIEWPSVVLNTRYSDGQLYVSVKLTGLLESEHYTIQLVNNKTIETTVEGRRYLIETFEFPFDFMNPKAPAAEIKSAASQGETIGSIVSAVPGNSKASADIINALISADPTGLSTKASQIIKIYNRVFYLRINFGDKFGAFMDAIEKVSGNKPSQEIDQIKLYGTAGWRGRLSEKKVSGAFFDDFNWKVVVYLLLWLISAIGDLLAVFIVPLPKLLLYAFFWLPKARIIIFNMVLLDFGFYAAHAMLHFSGFTAFIGAVCLALLACDLIQMVRLALTPKSWKLFYQIKIIPRLLPPSVTKEVSLPPMKDDKSQNTSKDAAGFAENSFDGMLTGKPLNQLSNSITPKTEKRIDYAATYANIGAKLHLVELMSVPIDKSIRAFGLPVARLWLGVHMSRMLTYQLLICACQYATGLALVCLLLFELSKLVLAVYLAKKKAFKSKLTVVVEVSQSFFSINFLVVMISIHAKSMDARIPELNQSLGIMLVIASVVSEYVLLIVSLVVEIIIFLRDRKKRKALNDAGKLVKPPASDWFIIYKSIAVVEPRSDEPQQVNKPITRKIRLISTKPKLNKQAGKEDGALVPQAVQGFARFFLDSVDSKKRTQKSTKNKGTGKHAKRVRQTAELGGTDADGLHTISTQQQRKLLTKQNTASEAKIPAVDSVFQGKDPKTTKAIFI